MTRSRVVAALILVGLLQMPSMGRVTAEEAARTEATAATAQPEWRFTVMPYIWASGMSGSIRPFAGAPTLSFDRTFSETIEDLDGALFLSFAAERDRLVILGDLTSVKTSRSGVLPGGIPADGALRQRMLSLAAGYRVHADRKSVVDLFGGFRAYRLEADVGVAGGALSASPTKSFVDPLLGVKASFVLSPRWSTTLYADFGGFGVGTESAVVVSALVNYQLGRGAVLSGGYRSMWIDYEDAGTLADVALGGPVLGLSFRF